MITLPWTLNSLIPWKLTYSARADGSDAWLLTGPTQFAKPSRSGPLTCTINRQLEAMSQQRFQKQVECHVGTVAQCVGAIACCTEAVALVW